MGGENPGASPGGRWDDLFTKGNAHPGEMVEALITDATSYDLYGEILGPAKLPNPSPR